MSQPISTFYDIFKFGMEFEMEIPQTTEFKLARRNQDEGCLQMLKITGDGSINHTTDGSTTAELITSKPIVSDAEEKVFFKEFTAALPNFKSKTEEDIFAYYNTSAGTHYHWSFQNKSDDLLYIFDTRAFQKFFITRYLDTFKSEKFLSRLNNGYCKAPNLSSAKGEFTNPNEVKRDLNKISLRNFNKEYKMADRYRWLNMQSVQEGTGAEIRLFPFLQTHSGVLQTTKFMKQVLLDYYALPATQTQLELLKTYHSFVDKGTFNPHKLSEIKQIVYEVLNEIKPLSGEARILFGQWIKHQPSLVTKSKAF